MWSCVWDTRRIEKLTRRIRFLTKSIGHNRLSAPMPPTWPRPHSKPFTEVFVVKLGDDFVPWEIKPSMAFRDDFSPCHGITLEINQRAWARDKSIFLSSKQTHLRVRRRADTTVSYTNMSGYCGEGVYAFGKINPPGFRKKKWFLVITPDEEQRRGRRFIIMLHFPLLQTIMSHTGPLKVLVAG